MSSEKKQFLDYEDNIAGRGGNSDYCVDEKKRKFAMSIIYQTSFRSYCCFSLAVRSYRSRVKAFAGAEC